MFGQQKVLSAAAARCASRMSATTTTTRQFVSATAVLPRPTEEMPFVHHGSRPRFKPAKKFKSPRKKASKLFEELNQEACEKQKASFPQVWQEAIEVGDSLELRMVSQGGLKESDKQELERVRGVVLGIVNRGLGSSVVLRDVVYGLPIERRIPLYSPMIKEAKILEKNFIFKQKKKVKRAKLYYFRDRNPLLTKVSKY